MNIDNAIFISFLIANVFFGIYSSRGIKTMREYAVGNSDFSTVTIAATLVATWVSGSDFFTYLTEAYNNGLYFIWAATGDVFCLLMIGIIFAPRLGEFLGKLSIADAMGNLYGEKVQVITAIAGCIGAGGLIAVQLKVAGMLFEYCFDIKSLYGVIIGGTIVTLYSSLGGIRSVTFTDIIQLFTFGTIIPAMAFFIISSLDTISVLTDVLSTHESFNYKNVFDFSQPKSFTYLLIFFFIAVPGFNPAIFQRIAMAKDVLQVRRSFIIAGLTCLFITATMSLIGILILSTNPNLETSQVVKHIIFNFPYSGIKGLILSGAMAMVLSTADSYINSTAVLFIHDFCKPLRLSFFGSELTATRFISVFIGFAAILLSTTSDSLLEIINATSTLYLPVVTVPFICSVFGFRSTEKSVLIGMSAGLTSIVVCRFILKADSIESVIPSMISNLVFLVGSHYVLKQSGGWVGIKDKASLEMIKNRRAAAIQKAISSVKNFNLIKWLKINTPKQDYVYACTGLFCIITLYATIYTLPKDIQLHNQQIINLASTSMLFLSTALISYAMWPLALRRLNFIPFLWNLAIFYLLVVMGFFFVIISNFAPMQLMILMANLIILSTFIRWQWSLIMMVIGLVFTLQFVKSYSNDDMLSIWDDNSKFRIMYLLILISSVLVIFLKPKQEQEELTEERANHLIGQIGYHQQELEKALKLKNEFIRNVSHEYHAPMTGVISTAETLWEGYDKLSDKLRRSAAENIYKSAIRLDSFDNNIRDLSRLSNPKSELNIIKFDLGQLINKRVELCKKLYIENQDKENYQFSVNLEVNIVVEGDEYYIKQTLDNLIINAITYCKKGMIKILFRKDIEFAKFSISDEGIGIPEEELDDIFGSFTVSSKTRTPAGGRGIGLALCKKVIELHGGEIKAQSNNGVTTFIFSIPLHNQAVTDSSSNEAIKIAKSLVSQGVEVKTITKATGLKKLEVEKLKEKK